MTCLPFMPHRGCENDVTGRFTLGASGDSHRTSRLSAGAVATYAGAAGSVGAGRAAGTVSGATPRPEGLVRHSAECVFTPSPLPPRGRSRTNYPMREGVGATVPGARWPYSEATATASRLGMPPPLPCHPHRAVDGGVNRLLGRIGLVQERERSEPWFGLYERRTRPQGRTEAAPVLRCILNHGTENRDAEAVAGVSGLGS